MSLPTLHLLSGDDESRLLAETRRVARELAGPDADDLTLEIVKETDDRGPEPTLISLLGAIQTPPFLGGSKTIVLSQFSAFANEPAKSDKDPRGVAGALLQLATLLEAGLPDGVNLVLSGPGVDARKRLATLCKARGELRFFRRPDPSRRAGRDELSALLREEAARRQMTLSANLIEYLIDLIGGDTGRLVNELEKLYCYAGAKPTLADAQTLCTGNREEAYWALANTLGDRDLKLAMTTLDRLMANQKDPDGMVIGQVRYLAKVLRELYDYALLADTLKARDQRRLMSAATALPAGDRARFRHNTILAQIEAIQNDGKSDFTLRQRAEGAARYQLPELRQALRLCADTDRLLVSSGLPPRLLLETLLIRILAR